MKIWNIWTAPKSLEWNMNVKNECFLCTTKVNLPELQRLNSKPNGYFNSITFDGNNFTEKNHQVFIFT